MRLDDYVYLENGCYPEVDALRDNLELRPASRLSALRNSGALAAGLLGVRTITLSGYLVGSQAVERFLAAHQQGLHRWYPTSDRYLNCEVSRVEVASAGTGVYRWTAEYTAHDPYYYSETVDEWQNWENRLTWSCDYTPPKWTNVRMSTTASQGTSRHGTNHGCRCVPTTDYGVHYVAQQLDPSIPNNTVVACAVDAVPDGYTYAALTLLDRAGNYHPVTYDLVNGTITYRSSGTYAEIIPSGVAGGWRCSIARSIASGASQATLYVYVANHPGPPADNQYAGDGSRGMYFSCAECQVDRWHARVSLHTESSRITSPSSGQVLHLYGPSTNPVPAAWTLYFSPSQADWYLGIARHVDTTDHMAFGATTVPTAVYVDMVEEKITGTGASPSMWLAGDFFLVTPGKDALVIQPSMAYITTVRLQVRQRWLSHLS